MFLTFYLYTTSFSLASEQLGKKWCPGLHPLQVKKSFKLIFCGVYYLTVLVYTSRLGKAWFRMIVRIVSIVPVVLKNVQTIGTTETIAGFHVIVSCRISLHFFHKEQGRIQDFS